MRKLTGFCLITGLLALVFSCIDKQPQTADQYVADEAVRPDVQFVIHLRAIDSCEVTLSPLTGDRAFTPVRKIENLCRDETDTITISNDYLPGEFRLEFSWKEPGGDTGQRSSGTYLIASEQDLELWVNPMYADDTDSTWFRDGDKENNAYRRFEPENNRRRENLSSLYASIEKYADHGTKSYKAGVRDYSLHRRKYNRWINRQIRSNSGLFFCQVLELMRIPESESEWSQSGKRHNRCSAYLNTVDFSNRDIIRVSGLKAWADEYVNLCVNELSAREERDSLLIKGGIAAIVKMKSENPFIYGWMTDYFYEQYQRDGNMDGVTKLQPYLNDQECLTSTRHLVLLRSAALQNIVPGKKAPDFHFINDKEEHFCFYGCKAGSGYKLILFWNTGCMNCVAVTRILHSWYLEQPPEKRPVVFAINLDQFYNKQGWKKRIAMMPEWEHMIDKGGIDSEVANAYGVFNTPFMILVDANTGQIISLPASVDDLAFESGK